MKKKVVLLGDGGVGKTSLVRRYVEQTFEDDYIATIGVNVKKKVMKELGLTLSIWDIFGQKTISTGPRDEHYRGADGALVVFDLTRRRTFNNLTSWIDGLFEVTGPLPVLILGNKYDLISDFQKEKKMNVKDVSLDVFSKFMEEHHSYHSIYRGEPDYAPVSQKEVKGWMKGSSKDMDEPLGYMNTSAKTGKNVERAFHRLGKAVR